VTRKESIRLLLGATLSHEWQLKAALRTLREKGEVPPERWSLLLSGVPEDTGPMGSRLKAEFPGVQVITARPNRPEFQFLAPAMERKLFALYFDYLRAWAWREISVPYLWIDSDVLVRGRLELDRIPQAPLAMAADFPTRGIPNADFHHRMWSAYGQMLKATGSAELTARHDSSGQPQNLNCGVLYVGEDLGPDWRRAFEDCLSILPRYKELISPPAKYAAGAESTFGQGIWNVLYSGRGGKELDWRWNNLKMVYPARQGTIDHYAVDKDAFCRDAKALGVIEED